MGGLPDYPAYLRRIRFKGAESGKTLVFLTNNFALPAETICALYKSRWQVELFFKWIKQHLRIKKFYGTSENAVKSQIWIAVWVYVLVAIVKKRLNLDASLYTLLQIFFAYPVREDAHPASLCGQQLHFRTGWRSQPIESIRVFTGRY